MCAHSFTSALKSLLHNPLSAQELMCLIVLILIATALLESSVLMSKYYHSSKVQVSPPGGTNDGLDWRMNKAISEVLNMSK